MKILLVDNGLSGHHLSYIETLYLDNGGHYKGVENDNCIVWFII